MPNKFLNVLIVAFCFTFTPAVFAQNKTQVDTVKQNEEFVPFSLGDYNIEIPPAVTEDENALDIDEVLRGEEQNGSEVKEQVVPGFRVQLVTTRDEEEARNVRQDAIVAFTEKVYLSFDDPYYKVRIGDCISRFDANDLQELALSRGFFEAFVVRTNVRFNPGKVENSGSGDK